MDENVFILDTIEDAIKKGKVLKDKVAAISILKEDGKVYPVGGQACHAALRSLSGIWGGSKPKLVASRSMAESNNTEDSILNRPNWREMGVLFANYLINESPYASTILTKDPEFAYSRGIVSDAKTEANLMVAGQTAHRSLWEHRYVVVLWNELRKSYSGDMAFLLSYLYIKKGNKMSMGNLGWHAPLTSRQMTSGFFTRFHKREINQFYKIGSYAEKKIYTAFSAIWEDDGIPPIDLCNGAVEWVKDKGQVVEDAPKNPFKAAYEVEDENLDLGTMVRLKDMLDILPNYWNNTFGEWIYA